jgi:hypothetical protein
VELVIRSLNTGKVYRIRESCLVPRREPDKLALLYTVGAVWCISPLAPPTPLLYNGQALMQGRLLMAGDELHAGPEHWKVEEVPVVDPASDATPVPRCRVTVLGGVQRVTNRELLIGSERRCSLLLSGEEGVQPLHALLSPLAGQWTLQALSSAGLDVPDQGRVKSLIITSGTRVLLGQERLVFSLVTDDSPGDTGSASEVTYGPDSQFNAELPAEAGNVLLLAEARNSEDPLLARCAEILHNLLTDHLAPAPRKSFLGQLGGLVNWSRETDEDTLNRIQTELAYHPRGRDSWVKFARFLEKHAYFDLCRLILEQMLCRQLATDAVVVALIRLYILLGQDKERSGDERLRHCRRAERLASRLLQRRAGRTEIADLRKTAASERTILENERNAARS